LTHIRGGPENTLIHLLNAGNVLIPRVPLDRLLSGVLSQPLSRDRISQQFEHCLGKPIHVAWIHQKASMTMADYLSNLTVS
jgi:hypothetical protein